jgi:aminoglycoside 3'-phosphotransferase-2
MSRDDALAEEDAREVLESLELPVDWRIRLAGYTPRLVTIGESGAVVIRLDVEDRPPLFLKSDTGAFAEVPAEVERLHWMAAQNLPAPRVVDQIERHGAYIMLMTGVPGRDLASIDGIAATDIARLAGEALAALHRHPPQSCPFDHRIDNRLAVARLNLMAGRVEPVWDLEQSPAAAWDELLATRPGSEELVVTHGDACLPNLMAEGGRFTGFVDCGRLGLADRWQDLSLAIGSLERNYGPGLTQPFLEAYGLGDIDEKRLAWYGLLDEFF